MKKSIITFAILTLLVTVSNAEIVLDQQFTPEWDTFTQFNEKVVAQTFTVGMTGWLTELEVLVSQLDPVGNLIVEIQKGVSQGPVITPTSILTSISLPLASLPSSSSGGTGPDFVSISLPIPSLSVSQGDELAIVLYKDRGGQSGQYGVVWFGCGSGTQPDYPSGMGLQFRPEGWVFDWDGNSYYLPDRWEGNPQLSDYGFRTYIEPVPEPTTALLLGLGGLVLRKNKRQHRCSDVHP